MKSEKTKNNKKEQKNLSKITESDFASKGGGKPIRWCEAKKENEIYAYSDIQKNCPPHKRTVLYEDGPGKLIPEKGISPSLIKQLNEIQDRLGKKVIIESGVRDYKHNLWSWAKLEGDKAAALEKNQKKIFKNSDRVSLNSWHMSGDAADFRIEGCNTDKQIKLLKSEANLLKKKHRRGHYHAYATKEGRDPDNTHNHPYIHADNKGLASCKGKNIKYRKVFKDKIRAKII